MVESGLRLIGPHRDSNQYQQSATAALVMRRTTNIHRLGLGTVSSVVNSTCRIPESGSGVMLTRRRLLRSLEKFDHCKIVLLIAPPGTGKTECARQIAESRRGAGQRVAWLSLMSAATNVETLLLSMVKSLSLALERPDEIASTQPIVITVRDRLNELINELDASGLRLTLIVDGYDAVNLLEVHKELERFASDVPSNVQLVITTRCLVPWALGRYRVADELAAFEFPEIRFDDEESARFVAQNARVLLDGDQMRQLVRASDGWIAVLKLTTLALKPGQSRRRVASIIDGRNELLEAFLSESVFEELSDEAQELLVSCGGLERLSVSLCEHITGSDSASRILESLAHDHFFVKPVDFEHSWSRVHPILARFLRSRFGRKPHRFQYSVHRRACEWYLENEVPREALRHAIAIDDYEFIREILRQHGGRMVEDGVTKMLTDCMDLLPDLDPQSEPVIAVIFVWTCVVMQRYEEARHRLTGLQQAVECDKRLLQAVAGNSEDLGTHLDVLEYRIRQALDPDWADPKVWEELRGAQQPTAHFKLQHIDLALAAAYLRRARYSNAYTTYMSVRSHAKATNSRITSVAASIRMAKIRLIQGRMSESLDLCDEILFATEETETLTELAPVSGIAYLTRAQIHYERNNLERCERDLSRARSLLREFGLTGYVVPLEILAAHVVCAKCGPIAASSTLAGIDRVAANEGRKRPLERVWASQAWFLLQAQDLETAESLLERLEVPVHRKGPSPTFSCSVTEEDKYRALSLYLIATGRTCGASAWLTKLIHLGEATGRTVSRVGFGALLALCHWRAGHSERAHRSLRQALVLAEQCGCLRSIVDTSPDFARLLREFIKLRGASGGQSDRVPSDTYLNALLEVAEGSTDGAGVPSSAMTLPRSLAPRTDRLFSRLTPRETEILTCICDGLSNRAISQDLMIGEGTVKWHTKNVYSKLGVNSRTQAAAKARVLHLVNRL